MAQKKDLGKDLDIILKLLNEALDNDYPLLLVSAGHNQTGVLVHGDFRKLIYLLCKAMDMDTRLHKVIIPAADIFREATAAANVADEVQKFLADNDWELPVGQICKEDIKDVPGNELDPKDCEKCKEHGKCEVEKYMNEMLIKKFKHGRDYQA